MTNKEHWLLLFEDKRFRSKSPTILSDGRNPFENDYGRLISSAPIRRLQDKTQVFPLDKNDYIRTRLTHSLEVSYIASSLGQSVEKFLVAEKEDISMHKSGCLSSLLRTSGLVHDLGNPPFGHFGEIAIQDFFKKFFDENPRIARKFSQQERADFENFDGNIQTFRILSKLYYFGDEYGYNLTYSTLATIVKYPSDSVTGNKGKQAKEIAQRKAGYFVTEEDKYKEINDYLQLNHRRHPATYLLEAADDIAYSAADIEDGVKQGIISIDEIEKIFTENLKNNKDEVLNYIECLKQKYSSLRGKVNDSIIVQKIRILTQRIMISSTIETFISNYDTIMRGELEDELIMVSNARDVRKAYKEIQSKIFMYKPILKKEIAGREAIMGLLTIFVEAALSDNFKANGGNTLECRLYNLVSASYRMFYEKYEHYENQLYCKLRLVVDFIAGMTDSYAIDLYQELKGIKL